MASVNFMGSYSGIDQNMINQLMGAERIPLKKLEFRKEETVKMQNAWRDVNTRMNSLLEKMRLLENPDTFSSKAVTSTNESIVTATANRNAMNAVYDLHIETIATAISLVGSRLNVESTNTELGLSGGFIIRNHEGVESEINLESGDSLRIVVQKINGLSGESGINATIIDNRLILQDSKTGEREIHLEAIDGQAHVLDELGLGAEIEVRTGTQARFTLNGIVVVRDHNTLSDVIEGVTLQLVRPGINGEGERISITSEFGKSEKAMQEFVDQYNSTMSFIETQLRTGTPGESGTRGTLAGDSSLRQIHATLRQMVTSPVESNENSTIRDLSMLGVSTTDRTGKLSFDQSVFREEMEKNIANVQRFFTSKNDDGESVGYTQRMKDYLDSLISGSNSMIRGKNESYDQRMRDLDRQIENFTRRLQRREEYYIRTFSALDVAMQKAESQMAWISSQLSSLNPNGNQKR
jgi:flagellar hook-associated protein 2